MNKSTTKASAYWEGAYFDANFNRAEWQAHPLTLERLARIQGSLPREDWFFQNHLNSNPVQMAISIGAGRAEAEIEMLRKGYVEHFVLVDIAASSMRKRALPISGLATK